jgi:predicted nucleic acid-binding protein
MHVLIDTGILLRAFDRSESQQKSIFRALRHLWSNGHQLVTTSQNIAEFWNVSTRPASARGGFGMDVASVDARVKVIERLGDVLPFSVQAYQEWRRLVIAHQICGVSVHDARIVAVMHTLNVTHLLTLNGADFQRYPKVTVLTPDDFKVAN